MSSPQRNFATLLFFRQPTSLTMPHLLEGTAAVTLLSDGELDTLALGQGDPGLVLTDDEDVGLAGGEGVVNSVLDVDDVETTIVALTVGNDTDTTHVTTTGGHGDNTSVELDEVGDLASGNVDLHGVVDLDGGVGVTDAIKKPLLAHFVLKLRLLTVFQQRTAILVLSSSADQPKLGPTTE